MQKSTDSTRDESIEEDGTNSKTPSSDKDINLCITRAEDTYGSLGNFDIVSDAPDRNVPKQVSCNVEESIINVANVAGVVYGGMGNRTAHYHYNSDVTPGTSHSGKLDILIENAEAEFVETDIYRRVEEILKVHGHVTISGASGEGKTTMALMLGAKYRKNGYQITFIDDIDKFKLDMDLERQTFCIFDDVFGTVGLTTDVSHLRRILKDVQLYLDKCKSLLSKQSLQEVTERKELKFVVVFTTKTYNLEAGMSKLKGHEFYLFNPQSVIDMTTMDNCKYSAIDRENILRAHKQKYSSPAVMDIQQICKFRDSMFGFPLTCKLYFDFKGFQKQDAGKFFRDPSLYLMSELNKILQMKNEHSAALILMVLYGENLSLGELEMESLNDSFENKLKAVELIVKPLMRADIARAAREYRGTFFTEGDVIAFSHPAIYNACTCSLFSLYPIFVMSHCSIKFLYERIHPDPVQSTKLDDTSHIIYVSRECHDVIARRLAEGIWDGIYSMTVAHPILKRKELVDKVLEVLDFQPGASTKGTPSKQTEILHSKEKGRGFLYWAMHAQSLYLVEKIFKMDVEFSEPEMNEAFRGCITSGNVPVMQTILEKFRKMIGIEEFVKALMTAAVTGNYNMFECLVTALTETPVGSGDLLRHLAHLAEDRETSEKLLPASDVTSLESAQSIGNLDTSVKLLDELLESLSTNMTLHDGLGNTMLHLACKGGNRTIVELLLPSFDINCRGERGWTPIMNAVARGKHEVFDMLISKGADVQIIDNYGDTALHIACQRGHIPILKDLLKSFDINTRGHHGMTPVMVAARDCHSELFDLLEDAGADLSKTDIYGDTILHIACVGGMQSIVEHILPKFDINCRGQHGLTPVMLSAVRGKKEVFDLLVDKGADLTLTDDYGNTSFHLACQGGSIWIAGYLLPSADMNSRGQKGWTPLMTAAVSGHTEIVDMLVSKGSDLTLIDNFGDNVLHLACVGESTFIVEDLLKSVDINSRGRYGWTPLMKTAFAGKEEIFHLLLLKGADLALRDTSGDTVINLACQGANQQIVEHLLPLFDINTRGQHNRTPIMNAAVKGEKEVFELLVKNRANLTLTDEHGDNLLHLASAGGNVNIVCYLLEYFNIDSCGESGLTPIMKAAANGKEEVFNLLMLRGADLTRCSRNGFNILHLACQGGNSTIIQTLLPEFDMNTRGQFGSTPIMNAAYTGKSNIVDLLISKGADLTLTDDTGDSVLHLACAGGNAHIVEKLLPAYDINLRGQHGWTPVMNAAVCGKMEVYHLLVTKGADLTLTDPYGDSILHLVCREGNLSVVTDLLSLYDIDIKGEDNATPIMNAAVCGRSEIFDLLLADGADITLMDNVGNSVFHLACRGGSTSIIESLLKHESTGINMRGENGWTPVMNAVKCGKHEAFNLLMSKGADLTQTDDNCNNVLHHACQGGNLSICKDVLPLVDINSRGENGWTPVMMAVYDGQNEIFSLLVKNGADLKRANESGDTAFHLACEKGNMPVVLSIMPLFDINTRGTNGHTPLMRAVCGGQVEVFKFLVSHHANVCLVDGSGDSLLHLACEKDNLDIVRDVVLYCDINSRNHLGWTPPMVALINGQDKIFQYLMNEGADLTVVDKVADGMLKFACYGGCTEIIQQLASSEESILEVSKWTQIMKYLAYGYFDGLAEYEIGSHELIQRDSSRDTLLHFACRGGNVRCVEHILPSYDINVRGRHGWTPVLMAAVCGNMEVFHYLVSQQADVFIKTENDEDVLDLACRGGNVRIIKYLMFLNEFHDRILYVSLNGNSLLHLACMGGSLKNVNNLLPFDDINMRGQFGWTPIMAAALCGHLDVVQCLLYHRADLTTVSDAGRDVLSLAKLGRNWKIETCLIELPEFQLRV